MPLSDVTCDKGECVTLRCKVCGRPKATVSWKGPDQNTLTNNGHFSIAYRYTITMLVLPHNVIKRSPHVVSSRRLFMLNSLFYSRSI